MTTVPRFCEKCGGSLTAGAGFCEDCGNPVASPATTQQQDVLVRERGGATTEGGPTIGIADLIPDSIKNNLSPAVRSEVAKMPAEKQEFFVDEYRAKAKSTGLTYFLWLLPIVGLHYLYLGNLGMALFFFLSFGGLGIWWFVDIFRIPGMVKSYNRDVGTNALRTLRVIGL